jgi:hypothetical protein
VVDDLIGNLDDEGTAAELIGVRKDFPDEIHLFTDIGLSHA